MVELPFEPFRRGDPTWPGPPKDATLGWRAWAVSATAVRHGLAPRLFSVGGSGFYWKPWRESVAECSNGCDREGGSGIPDEKGRCACGFYSGRSFEHLKALGYQDYEEEGSGWFRVVGVVANWGKVIPGSLGWRAEKSYPLKLFVPYEAMPLAKPLRDTYRVQVALLNTLKKDHDNELDQRKLLLKRGG